MTTVLTEAQLIAQLERTLDAFPSTILIVRWSRDDKIMVYKPIITATGELERIEMYQANLADKRGGIHPELVTLDVLINIFGMKIEAGKKKKRYTLSIPVMEGVTLDARVCNGQMMVKAKIEGVEMQIRTAYVSFVEAVFPSIYPTVDYIEVSGIGTDKKPVEKSILNPDIFKGVSMTDMVTLASL